MKMVPGVRQLYSLGITLWEMVTGKTPSGALLVR
jgi:hypothetical protein